MNWTHLALDMQQGRERGVVNKIMIILCKKKKRLISYLNEKV
jgi:hypothetical protein